jgi:uncharacterized membrane protein
MTEQRPDQVLVARLADARGLDESVDRLRSLASKVLADQRVDDALSGRWLGHPLHPALTDLPIGFWTSAFVLDVTGRKHGRAADLLIALGLVSALPTMAAGLADWRERDRRDQRIGVGHAAANGAAWILYAMALKRRVRGRRLRGRLLALAGAAAATAGGYLGGQLAYGTTPEEGSGDRDATAASNGIEEAGIVDQDGAALEAVAAAQAR